MAMGAPETAVKNEAYEAPTFGDKAKLVGAGLATDMVADKIATAGYTAATQKLGAEATKKATAKLAGKYALGGTLPGEILTGAYDHYHIAKENAPERREKHGESLIDSTVSMGFGTAASTAVLYGGATISTGGIFLIGLGAAAVGVGVKEGAKYMLDFHAASDSMFQSNLQVKQHMLALNRQFRKDIADPNLKEMRWSDLSSLKRYETWLNQEVLKRENIFREKNFLLPRWVKQLSDPNGVAAQEDARVEMRIAKSAQEELKLHIEQVSVWHKEQQAMRQAIFKLSGDGKGNLTIRDLKRTTNNPDTLTEEDKKEIEKVIGKEMAPKIFAKLEEGGITFKNQSILEAPKESIAPELQVEPPHPVIYRDLMREENTQETDTPPRFSSMGGAVIAMFRWIKEALASLGQKIMGLFKGNNAEEPTATVAAAPVAAAANVNTEPTAEVTPPQLPRTTKETQQGK